jgi:hypothetical protein
MPHGAVGVELEQPDLGVGARHRVSGAVVRFDARHTDVEIELYHSPVLALVEVGGAVVHLLGRPGAVDVADRALALVGDDAHRGSRCVAQAHAMGGPARADPHSHGFVAAAPVAYGQLVGLHEASHAVVEHPRPPALVGMGEGELVGRAAEVRVDHKRVGRVDHRGLRGAREQLGGMGGQPLVELVAAGDEHSCRGRAVAARPPCLLPERGDGAGEAVDHHRVEPTHVDAELERRGGDHARQLAGRELVFDRSALFGQVAAPVRPYAPPE